MSGRILRILTHTHVCLLSTVLHCSPAGLLSMGFSSQEYTYNPHSVFKPPCDISYDCHSRLLMRKMTAGHTDALYIRQPVSIIVAQTWTQTVRLQNLCSCSLAGFRMLFLIIQECIIIPSLQMRMNWGWERLKNLLKCKAKAEADMSDSTCPALSQRWPMGLGTNGYIYALQLTKCFGI